MTSETKKMWAYSAVFAIAAAVSSYVIASQNLAANTYGIISAVLITTIVALFWSRFLVPTLFTRNKLSVFNQVLFGIVVATFTIFISAGIFGLTQLDGMEAITELGFFGLLVNVLGSGVMVMVFSYLMYWWLILPLFVGSAMALRWLTLNAYIE